MLQHLLDRRPTLRVLRQKSVEQVLGLGAEHRKILIALQVERLVADTLVSCRAVVIPEGRRRSQQNVQEAPQGPDVDWETIGLSLDDLWGHVAGRANFEGELLEGRLQFDTAAEIGNDRRGVDGQVVHQNVLDLDVTVHDEAVVERFNSAHDMTDYLSGVHLRKRLDCLLHQVVEEVAGWHELGDDVDVVRVFESLDHLQDIGAAGLAGLLEELELRERLLLICEEFSNFFFRHELYGHFCL